MRTSLELWYTIRSLRLRTPRSETQPKGAHVSTAVAPPEGLLPPREPPPPAISGHITRVIPIINYSLALVGLKELASGIDTVTTRGVFQTSNTDIDDAIAIINGLANSIDKRIVRIEAVLEDPRYKGTPRTGIFLFRKGTTKPTIFVKGATIGQSREAQKRSKRLLCGLGISERDVFNAGNAVLGRPYIVVFQRAKDAWEWRKVQ